MKKKYFYSHLTETTEISLELGDMKLTQEERLHLISLADANIHSAVLDKVLSELSEEDKKIFLTHFTNEDHDKLWEHIGKKIDNAEEKIKETARETIEELIVDIKEVKK